MITMIIIYLLIEKVFIKIFQIQLRKHLDYLFLH